MKDFTVVMKVSVNDQDTDVMDEIPNSLLDRYRGTAIMIMEINVYEGSEPE